MSETKLLLPAQIQAKFQGEGDLQTQITEAIANVKIIVVDTAEKVPIANSRIGTINALLKTIDDARKEAKKPYWDTGAEIDAYAKTLTVPLESGKKTLNSAVLGFKKTQEAELIIEQDQKAQKLKLDEQAKKNELALLGRIRDQINARLFGGQYVTGGGVVCPCEPAKNIPECTEIYLKLQQEFPHDFFIHLKKDAEDTFKELSDVILNHQKKIANLVKDGQLEQYLVSVRAKVDGDKHQAEAKIENQIQKDSKKAVKKQELDMKATTKGIRKTIAFEVEDKRLIPDEFLSVDAVKVNEWIKNNKQLIQDGLSKEGTESPISGLRFYEHSTYVSK